MDNLPFLCAGAWLCVDCSQGSCPEHCMDDHPPYVLPDAVRVVCHCPEWGFYKKPVPICPKCHGLGWTPATDFLVWFNMLPRVKMWASIYHNEKQPGVTAHVWYKNEPGAYITREEDILEALLGSIHAALESMAATFPEVKL